jgi:hypothetical protein
MNLTRKREEKPIWTAKGNSILLTIDIRLGIICTNHPLLVIKEKHISLIIHIRRDSRFRFQFLFLQVGIIQLN